MKIFCQLILYRATAQHNNIEGMLGQGRITYALIPKHKNSHSLRCTNYRPTQGEMVIEEN
jgi:hypothetical protein